jgi:hypothetical protein
MDDRVRNSRSQIPIITGGTQRSRMPLLPCPAAAQYFFVFLINAALRPPSVRGYHYRIPHILSKPESPGFTADGYCMNIFKTGVHLSAAITELSPLRIKGNKGTHPMMRFALDSFRTVCDFFYRLFAGKTRTKIKRRLDTLCEKFYSSFYPLL